MEARLSKLETEVSAIRLDVAVLKSTSATKSDLAEFEARTRIELAEVRGEMRAQAKDLDAKLDIVKSELRAEIRASVASSQNKIILWVVSFIFLAQLLPMMKDVVANNLAEQTSSASATTTRSATPAARSLAPSRPKDWQPNNGRRAPALLKY